MKIHSYYLIALILTALFLNGCSELKDDLAAAPEVGIHEEGILQAGNVNFHGNLIRNANWNMTTCKSCHASDYSGGTAGSGCLGCHTQPSGPEACNTCHGSLQNPNRIAPPQSLDNATNTSDPGVGAHEKHLYDNVFGLKVACGTCHTMPSSFDDPVHIDNSPGAELLLSGIAGLVTNDTTSEFYASELQTFTPNPSYDAAANTCSEVYCHGYFKNGNTDNAVSWTAGSTGAACGSCHGDPTTGDPLPKTSDNGGTHLNIASCNSCHSAVVDVQGGVYTIINDSLHINGKLNVYGDEKEL